MVPQQFTIGLLSRKEQSALWLRKVTQGRWESSIPHSALLLKGSCQQAGQGRQHDLYLGRSCQHHASEEGEARRRGQAVKVAILQLRRICESQFVQCPPCTATPCLGGCLKEMYICSQGVFIWEKQRCKIRSKDFLPSSEHAGTP